MILAFLRAIRHQLLDDLARLEQDKVLLQDRLERSDQERSRVWAQNETLIAQLTTYFRMDKNLEWQTERHCAAPFPDDPHLPSSYVRPLDNTPLPPRHSQGSQFVEDQTRKFREKTKVKFNLVDVSQ